MAMLIQYLEKSICYIMRQNVNKDSPIEHGGAQS